MRATRYIGLARKVLVKEVAQWKKLKDDLKIEAGE